MNNNDGSPKNGERPAPTPAQHHPNTPIETPTNDGAQGVVCQHERENEDLLQADLAMQNILVRYSVRKNGCTYLKTRTHGLILLADISDAIWDQDFRQREAVARKTRKAA